MASEDSYTVLIVPFQNSHKALHCFQWLKRRKDLERQKDVLWHGLQFVEQTQNHLQTNQCQWSCALRSCLQRVNGSLGGLLSDSCLWSNLAPQEHGALDWNLRWSNAALVKEVHRQDLEISMLELEKTRLLQQLIPYRISSSARSSTRGIV